MDLEAVKESERLAKACICCGSDQIHKSPAILMPFVAKRVFDWEPVEITADWGLNTIKSGMAYPLCNSVQCSICGAMFLDIRFSDSEMAALYSGYRDDDYTNLRERFEPGYKDRNRILNVGSNYIPKVEEFLSQYVKSPMRVLDWGGDTGINTPFKRPENTIHVYDISDRRMVDGVSRVEWNKLKDGFYDLVILSNVLEHIPDPASVLKKVSSVIQRESLLYIEVPHEELVRTHSDHKGLVRKKRHWHEHINFFTEDSLFRLLARSGFSVLNIESLNISVGGKNSHVFALACKLS